MGFFTGFATGLATSIDKKLQEDMKKTEDRIYEMQERGIVRARAKEEKKEKQTEQLTDVLKQLASFTGGNEEKAIQLYEKSGNTIDGATAFIKTLRANEEAGKDINALIKYVDAGDPRDFDTFTEQNTIRVTQEEVGEVKGAGIYGALFNPDFGGRVKKGIAAEIDFDKPIKPEDKLPSRMAKIDYSGFLSAEEAAFQKKERQLIFDRFNLDKSKFDLLSKETKEKLQLAQKAQTLSEQIAKSEMDERTKESARNDAKLLIQQAELAIAQEEAGLRSTQITQQMGLTDIKIDIAEYELEKMQKAPEFATHEAMLIAADNELAALEIKDPASLTQDEKNRMQQLETLRDTALAGIKDAAEAANTSKYKPSVSTQSIDSIINNELKRAMGKVGLYDSLTESIAQLKDGNAVAHLTAQHRGLKNAAARNILNDLAFTATIQSNRADLNADIQDYAGRQYQKLLQERAKAEGKPDLSGFAITEEEEITAYIQQFRQSNPNASPSAALNKFAEENNLVKGHIIKAGDKFLMWTGQQFIGA